MNDAARQTLCDVIRTHGRSLCDDPRRCEAFLRDHCPEQRREIFVLISALHERVAADLSAGDDLMPMLGRFKQLARRLVERLGLRYDLALWAVESWALALGAVTPDTVPKVPFVCPRCGFSGPVGLEYAGARVTCRRCRSKVHISPDGERFVLETDGRRARVQSATGGAEAQSVSTEDLFRQVVSVAAADGKIVGSESAVLEELRRRLALPAQTAAGICSEILARQRLPDGHLMDDGPAPPPSGPSLLLPSWVTAYKAEIEAAAHVGLITTVLAAIGAFSIMDAADVSPELAALGGVIGALLGAFGAAAATIVSDRLKGRVFDGKACGGGLIAGGLAGAALGSKLGLAALLAVLFAGAVGAGVGAFFRHIVGGPSKNP